MAAGTGLSPAAQRAALDTVAELIAATIDGARGADVHAVLAPGRAAPGEWRRLVQQRATSRRDAEESGAQRGGSGEAPTVEWVCPKCSAACTAVDARGSLRSMSTAKGVRELSNDENSCSVCASCGESLL